MGQNIVTLGYEYFPDTDKSRAISNGSIFVGVVNLDPEILANQKQVTLRLEDNTEVQVSQPIKTNSGGLPVHVGQVATILVDGSYAIKVLNQSGAQVFFNPDVTNGVPLTVDEGITIVDNVSDLVSISELSFSDKQGFRVTAYNPGWEASGGIPNGGGGFTYNASVSKSNHNGGTIISPTVPFSSPIADFLAGVGETDPGGSGCLVRNESSQEKVNIESFGAEPGDSQTVLAGALIAALGAADVVEINEPFEATFNATQAVTVLEEIDRVRFNAKSEITLPSGEISMTKRVLMSNSTLINLTIAGTDTGSATATSATNTGGSIRDYDVDYVLADASGVALDDYVIITGTSGTGDFRVVDGCFRVTSKVSNTIRVKHTLDNATFPTFTLTNATVWPLKTILRWPANTVGIAISGADVFTIKNLVIAGSFNVTSGARADRAADGLQVGASPNTPETGLNESQQTNAGSLWMARSGVVEWEGNGLQVIGGNFYGVLTSICSNSWRGYQVSRSGSCNARASAAVGNLNGYESESNGSMIVNDSVASGNSQQGYFSIGTGDMTAGSSETIANGSHGYDSRNNAAINADGGRASFNILNGLTTTAGFILFGAGAVSENNGDNDVLATEGGRVDGNGGSDLGTVSISSDSGASVIDTDGDLIFPLTTRIENSSEGKVQLSITSIGDLTFSFDPTNSGSFTDRFRIRNIGQTHPLDDNLYSFGRADFRWSELFAGNGTINTSDQREKTQPLKISDEVLDAWATVDFIQYQWLASVEKKGDDARTHIGLIAQDIRDKFAAVGLDATKYGFLCYDEWEEEKDDSGKVISEAGNRWGIRPDQCLFLESALMRRELKSLKDK